MGALLEKYRPLIARFGRDDQAAAIVEFALILPFLLLLYLGSIEASSLYTVDRRVSIISGTMADLVARWDPYNANLIFANDILEDYFRASQGIITPYPETGLTQVVSVLAVDADGAVTVKWSCAWNGGVARNAGDSYPLTDETQINQIAQGSYLIAAEVEYPYEPVMGMVFKEPLNLRSENLFLPRFGDEIKAPVGGCPS